MRSRLEQLSLFRLDLDKIVRVDVSTPERRVLQIFFGPVAEQAGDVLADEGGSEIAARGETVDDHGSRRQQQVQSGAHFLPGLLGFFARRDVGPRAHDLGRLAVRIAHHLLAIFHPEIGALRTADAILDRALVALEHPVDPFIDARHVFGMNPIPPKVWVLEILPGGAAKQLVDALAHIGRVVVAARHPAIKNGGRSVEQAREVDVRRGLDVGDPLQLLLFLFARRCAERLLKGFGYRLGVALPRRRQNLEESGRGGFRMLSCSRHDWYPRSRAAGSLTPTERLF